MTRRVMQQCAKIARNFGDVQLAHFLRIFDLWMCKLRAISRVHHPPQPLENIHILWRGTDVARARSAPIELRGHLRIHERATPLGNPRFL